MFRRKAKAQEATSEDIPETLGAWEMLDEAQIASETAALKSRFPDENWTAFSRRPDTAEIACFDKGHDGVGKAIVIVGKAGVVRRYPGFGAWFDTAVQTS